MNTAIFCLSIVSFFSFDLAFASDVGTTEPETQTLLQTQFDDQRLVLSMISNAGEDVTLGPFCDTPQKLDKNDELLATERIENVDESHYQEFDGENTAIVFRMALFLSTIGLLVRAFVHLLCVQDDTVGAYDLVKSADACELCTEPLEVWSTSISDSKLTLFDDISDSLTRTSSVSTQLLDVEDSEDSDGSDDEFEEMFPPVYPELILTEVELTLSDTEE